MAQEKKSGDKDLKATSKSTKKDEPKALPPVNKAKSEVKPAKPKEPATSTKADLEPETFGSVAPIVESSSKTESKPKSRINRKIVAFVGAGVLAVAVVLMVVFGVMIYKYKSDSSLVYAVAKVVPYPVEKVNGSYISYGEYLFELKSVKQYYQSQTTQSGQQGINFNSTEGKAKLATLRTQVLTQLTNDAITKQLINKNNIKVSTKEVNNQVDQIVKASGGLDKVKNVLTKFYGWTLDDLKVKVKYQLARQKLQDKLSADNSLKAQAKAKAEDVEGQIKAGGDFATLAKKYSQDSSAANGGDLGFLAKGQTVKQFEDAAFALEVGQVSPVVKTQYGYHIIKALEYNADKTQIHASQILIEPINFDNYLKEQIKKAKVSKYLKV